MSNIDQLCPLVLPLKDMLTACREIEEFIKGSTGSVGRSNEELMAEFLSGSGSLAEQLAAENSPINLDEVSLDEDGIVGEGVTNDAVDN